LHYFLLQQAEQSGLLFEKEGPNSMDEHINLVPSNYSEQHRPQGHADIALLQAAIEA
jgi:hypothetical protein